MVDLHQFSEMPALDGTVIENTTLPLDWSKNVYHSAAMPGFRLVIEREDGSRLVVLQEVTDANWAVGHLRSVKPGARCSFGSLSVEVLKDAE